MEIQLSIEESQERLKHSIVPTLNKMGYMNESLNEFTQAFLDYSSTLSSPVLDIGTAYGFTTLEALKGGAQVMANDVSSEHLNVLLHNTPLEFRENLTLKPGRFPDELDFPSESVGAILASRILHFLTGDQIEEGVRKIFKWLKPGGKAFIITETPYKKMFESFLPHYEERKKKSDKWPGEIDDITLYATSRAENLPSFMHLLEESVLKNIFLSQGFIIEYSKSFSKASLPLDAQLDGRETAGVIAVKPSP